MLGFGTAPAAVVGLSDMMRPDQEEVEDKYKGSGKIERPKDSPTGIPSKKEGPKIEEDVITDINKGNLDEMISEKIELFKSKLGDGSKRKKQRVLECLRK